MWEKDLVSIQEACSELNLTESQIRAIISKMQDRIDTFSIKLKSGERRLNVLELSVIEFISLRTSEGMAQDTACEIATRTFYADNKSEIIREYLETQLKSIGNV